MKRSDYDRKIQAPFYINVRKNLKKSKKSYQGYLKLQHAYLIDV